MYPVERPFDLKRGQLRAKQIGIDALCFDYGGALVPRDEIELEVSPLPACLFNQQIAQFGFLPKLSYREVHSREQLPLERRSVHEKHINNRRPGSAAIFPHPTLIR